MTGMPQHFWSLLEPDGENLTPDTVSRVQVQRLLTLLGAAFLPAFGLLHGLSPRPTVDPLGARLAISGLFLLLFLSSYASDRLRRNYVASLRGLLYVVGGWTVLLASMNHWTGGYVASLLAVYAALILVVGTGAQSIRPAFWFAGIHLVLVALAAPFDVAPYTSPVAVLGCMGTVAAAQLAVLRAYGSSREHLQTRDERFRDLVRSLPGVVVQFSTSPEGSFTTTVVSDRAEDLFGIPSDPTTFLGRFLPRIPSPHRERLIDCLTHAVDRQSPWRFEMPFDRPDGARKWLLGAFAPERDGEDRVIDGVLIDITERKRASRALEDRKQKTDALNVATERLVTAGSDGEVAERLEEIMDVIFDYALTRVHLPDADRPTSRNRCGNPGTQRTTVDEPKAPSRLYGTPPTETRHWRANDPADAVASSRGYKGMKAGIRVPIGSHGVLALASTERDGIDPLDVRLAEILASQAAAVLERIDREEELVAVSAEADRANRLTSAMLENMSHEFRTPLTSITGFAEILMSELDGRHANFGEQIYQSGWRLLHTLDAVLVLSELEAGTYDLSPEPLDLSGVLEQTVDDRRPDAQRHDVTLALDLPSTGIHGRWNREAVRRIVEILLDNALKFTPEGGTVVFRAREQDEAALLEVDDTGVGIRDDVVTEVFDAFRQESAGFDRPFEGCGLGLSIGRALVEALGGEIGIESEKHEGTLVTVRLPVQEPAPASAHDTGH